MKAIARAILVLVAATIATPLAYLSMLWWPLNPIELKSVKIMNDNNKVIIGQELIFQVHYIKHTEKSGRVYRQLLDGRVVNLAPHISKVPVGEAAHLGFIRTGPGDLPGKYRINYTIIYEYFGFRDVVVSAMSDEFTLMERSADQ